MRILSLFSGIGGLDLGVERATGGHCVMQCESDPFALSILSRHWPDVPRCTDVARLEAQSIPPYDVLVAGFPCQDISQANHAGRGLAGPRSGLWWEVLRIVRDTRPRGVVLENVDRLYRRGLDVVCAELCALGYHVEFARVSAASVGAPHRRLRIFVVAVLADSDSRGQQGERQQEHPEQQGSQRHVPDGRRQGGRGNGSSVGDPDRAGLEVERPQQEDDLDRQAPAVGAGRDGGPGPAEPGVGRAVDGVPSWMDGPGPGGQWPAGRGEPARWWEASRTARGVRSRKDRLRALGNACTPQQAAVAGARLLQLMEQGCE